MAQPGHPNKPDAFWWEMEKVLAFYGPQALMARDDLRRLLKTCVLASWVDAGDEPEPITPERFRELIRDHIYGWPPPGS